MRRRVIGSLIAVALAGGSGLTASSAVAGPWEDGMAAYNRGDYVPAIQVFRGMARAGNAKAQGMLGAMYQRGQGVARSSAHAFMWLSLAASRGDARAKAELKTVSATMTAEDLARARADLRIALTGEDGADHGQTARPGQRADDFVQFDVHPLQRFLHVLDMAGSCRDVVPAKAQIVLQTADIGRGNKAGPQQAMRMQRGAPLAVFHVGLASRKIARLAAIDHHHLHASCFQNSIER